MNETEFLKLTQVGRTRITAADLANVVPRTLLYGYTTARDTWHVYLDDRQHIHVLMYCGTTNMLLRHTQGIDGGVSHDSGLIPDKRLYPEACDAEFCALLKSAGVGLPFTTFNKDRPPAPSGFYGHRDFELVRSVKVKLVDVGPQCAADMPAACAALHEAAFELQKPLHMLEEYHFLLAETDLPPVVNRAKHLFSQEARERMTEFEPRRAAEFVLSWHLHAYDSYIQEVRQQGGCLIAELDGEPGLLDLVRRLPATGYQVTSRGEQRFHVQGNGSHASGEFYVGARPSGADETTRARYTLLIPIFGSRETLERRLAYNLL